MEKTQHEIQITALSAQVKSLEAQLKTANAIIGESRKHQRAHFAGLAMSGLIGVAKADGRAPIEVFTAERATAYADALLEELEK